MDPYQKHEKLILKLLSSEDRIEYALAEGKMSLVTEASAGVNEADLAELKSSVTDARKKLNKLTSAVANTPLSENEAFSTYQENLNKALIASERGVAEIEITDDPAEIQKTLGSIIEIETRVTSYFLSLEKTFVTFSKALTSVVPKDKLDEPIGELTGEGSKVPSEEKLKAGFEKAMSSAAAAAKKTATGGIFKQIVTGIKSLFGKGKAKASGIAAAKQSIEATPTPEALFGSVLQMSMNDINTVVKAIRTVKFQAPPEDATERFVAGLERARGEKGKGESGENTLGAEAPTSSSPDDEISSSIDHPRAADFIKALRDNPNTKVLFEEGFSLNENFYRAQLSSLLFEAPVKYSDILDVAKSVVPDDEAAQKKLAVSAAKAFKEKKKKTIIDVPDEAAAPDAKKDEESKPGEPDKKAPSTPEKSSNTFKGEINALKDKHVNDPAIVNALDQFYITVKDGVNKLSVDDVFSKAFEKFNTTLKGPSATNLLGDKESSDKLKSKLMGLVRDKIKLENRSNRDNSKSSVIVESRWAKLAGLKDKI
jgi:hypothetical protein